MKWLFRIFYRQKNKFDNTEIIRYVCNFLENSSKLFLQAENGGKMKVRDPTG